MYFAKAALMGLLVGGLVAGALGRGPAMAADKAGPPRDRQGELRIEDQSTTSTDFDVEAAVPAESAENIERAGGPMLRPTVNVSRQGKYLKLNYDLVDAEGRSCRESHPTDRSKPPRFVVYRSDREVGSGTFRYG